MTLIPVCSGMRHRCTIHDSSRGPFDRQTRIRSNASLAIERPSQRIDDPSEQSRADTHIHDAAGAQHLHTRLQVLVFTEQDHTDFGFIHIERNAECATRKFHQLLEPDSGKAVDRSNSGGDAGDRAHFA